MSLNANLSLEQVIQAEARRRRRLWRMILGVVVALVALVGVRVWWGFEAERRLQALIDGYHEAGEPILVEDFARTFTVPDEANAALVYQQASSALAVPAGTGAFHDFIDDPRFSAAYPDDAAKIIGRNKQTLALLRQARNLPEVDWGLRLQSPLINVLVPPMWAQRRLAKLARSASVFQHQAGDHFEAMETVRDIHALADKLGDEFDTFLITHLVRIAVDWVATNAIEQIAPTLSIKGTKSGRPQVQNPAGREQILGLIAELLDDQPLRASWRTAFYLERAMQLDCARLAADGKMFPPDTPGPGDVISNGFMQPAYLLDTVRMMEWETRFCKAGLTSNWQAAQKIAPLHLDWVVEDTIEGLAQSLSRGFMPTFDRALLLHFRLLADRHMAATALAIRLYEVDHGQRPKSLALLVPEYLTILPQDPFAADARSLGYKPNAAKPIVYSIGQDGRDDDGAFALRRPIWAVDGVDWEKLDMPFFLNGDRPMAPLELPEE